ncbi:DUF6296 family protein [Kitasatospora sp. NPDC094028]
MNTSSRYAITLPGIPGGHAPAKVVIVHATGETSRGGQPVFQDSAGTFRVEITAGVARPLAVAAGPGRHTCLHALPLP